MTSFWLVPKSRFFKKESGDTQGQDDHTYSATHGEVKPDHFHLCLFAGKRIRSGGAVAYLDPCSCSYHIAREHAYTQYTCLT